MNKINMKNIQEILISFEIVLKQYNPSAHSKLQNGLNETYSKEKFVNNKINDEKLRQLYCWKNGIKADSSKYIGEFDLSSFGKMIPLEEALTHYNMSIKDKIWSENYFPLFTTNAGDYLLYDIDKKSSTYGMLLLYSPSLLIVEPETIYDSLESFFDTLIDCYKEGDYKLNKSNYTLEIDDELETEKSFNKNPISDYWKK